jgi:hypothetical protein
MSSRSDLIRIRKRALARRAPSLPRSATARRLLTGKSSQAPAQAVKTQSAYA